MRNNWLPKLIQPHRRWIPYLVLIGTLSLTALATAYVQHVAQERDQIRFQNAIQRTENSIEGRVNTYIAMLRGGAGLFSAAETVTRDEFQAYVNRLLLDNFYPGVQGIGFAKRYSAAARDEIAATLQVEGFEDFALYPVSDRPVYYPIIYLEPLDRRNQKAVGYDMFTEPIRQAAMIQARDTGSPAASGKVTLVQEIDKEKQAGFLIYVPVYGAGDIPATVAERRDELEGFVYSPFRVGDLMEGIFGAEPYRFLNFRIYDGDTITPEALLYDSRLEDSIVPGYKPRFTANLQVSIADHPWTIVYSTRPAFDATSSVGLLPYVALGGTVISLILFGITRSQVRARTAAERIATELRQSELDLQQAHDELEIRVAERTAELSTANTTLQEQMEARRQAQVALERQASALKEQAKLLDLAHDSIFVRDMNSIILFWNQGAVEQYGWSKTEALGRPSHVLLQTQFAAPRADVEQALLQADRWDGELVHVTRDGHPKVVSSRWALQRDDQGNPLSVLEINSDITPQKQAEQSLQKALDFEALLKQITDRVRDSLDEIQILQTAVSALQTGLNVSACNIGLYDLEHEVSTIAAESTTYKPSVLGHTVRMADYPTMYETLLGEENLQICLFREVFAQNYVSVLACSIYDDQGVLGDLWLFRRSAREYTELEIRLVERVATQCAIAIRQARLYEEAQTQVKALEKLNWLKDDFLSTVSHELRTPVSNMRLAIRMLEIVLNKAGNLNGDRQKVQQYFQILQSECQREIDLINDLLDLQRLISGRQTIDLQTIDLADWLPQLVEPFRERATDRQQTLQLDLEPQSLPSLVTDIPSLERVLSEFLNNACKYTPPHETITLEARSRDGHVQFSVRNTGVEIPEYELAHIFDKFYRIPNADPWKQGGTGLGLALAQRLAEHMEGHIEVASVHNATTFTLVIPKQRSLEEQLVV